MKQGTFSSPPDFKSNDFLSQSSTRKLSNVNDPHGPIFIHIQTTLPPYVLPHYWKQFNLSKADVLLQAEFIPAKFYWVAALLSGIDVSASALRPSSSTIDQIGMNGKPSAIKKLAQHHRVKFNDSVSVISNSHSVKHVPPLPRVRVHPSEFKDLQLKDSKKRTFEYGPWTFVPIATEKDCILLNRVTPLINYEQSKRQRSGYASKPRQIMINNSPHALVEECVLVST